MPIPPLILKIVADSSGVKKGVAETNAQVSGLKNTVSANSALIKTALIGGVVAGIAAAVKAASDLNESQNKANVVFGQSVTAVNKFAESSAEGFGISKAAALESAGAFGAMFDSAGLAESASAKMSVTMTGLAGDMASFNNQDPSEMLERLRSGLSGEAEPLRRFGVFINEARVQAEAYKSGIAEVGTELTDAQKVQARYNIILQDTAKQQGDFGRTLGESLPNQIRVLKAEITDLAAEAGQALLPALVDLVSAGVDVLHAVGPVLTAAFEGLAVGMEKVAGVASELTATMELLKAALPGQQEGEEKISFWSELADRGIGAVKIAADFLTPGLYKLDDAIAQAEARAKELSDAEVVAADAAKGMGMQQIFAAQQAGLLSEETGELVSAHQAAAEAAREQRQAELALAGGLLGLVTSLQDVREAQDEVDRLRRRGKIDTEEYDEAVLNLAQSSLSFTEALKEYTTEQREAGAETSGAVAQLVDLGREFGFTKRDLQSILGPLREYVSGLNAIPSQVHTSLQLSIGVIGGLPAGIVRRQHGGPVSAMRPYVVGERGPELFVPGRSGTIVPNGGGGGDIILMVDREVLARATRDGLHQLGRRNVTAGIPT